MNPSPSEADDLVQKGLRILEQAPAQDFVVGRPPRGRGQSTGRYLWVIDDRGIPYVIEAPMKALRNNLPKHTNLTGGGPAYMGGELWFSSGSNMYLSGGSGRYPPRDQGQMDDAAGVFEAYNYVVTSLGWDTETGLAERVLKS